MSCNYFHSYFSSSLLFLSSSLPRLAEERKKENRANNNSEIGLRKMLVRARTNTPLDVYFLCSVFFVCVQSAMNERER